MTRICRLLALLLLLPSVGLASGELDMGAMLKSGPVDEEEYHVALAVEAGNLSTFAKGHYSEREGQRIEEKGHVGAEYDQKLVDSQFSVWLFEKVGYPAQGFVQGRPLGLAFCRILSAEPGPLAG